MVTAALAALLALSILAPGARAVGLDAEDFVRQLEASYTSVHSLRAHFTQRFDWGTRVRIESGAVTFARGGKMRWDYQEPVTKLFLSDGKNLWLYVPEAHQATRSPVKSSEDVRVPLRLLLSRVNLHKVFGKIEFGEGPANSGDRVLIAYPKAGEDPGFVNVRMEITPTFDIRRLLVTFTDHSTMEFTFDDLRRNAPAPQSLFRFTPPPGTEVIEQK